MSFLKIGDHAAGAIKSGGTAPKGSEDGFAFDLDPSRNSGICKLEGEENEVAAR